MLLKGVFEMKKIIAILLIIACLIPSNIAYGGESKSNSKSPSKSNSKQHESISTETLELIEKHYDTILWLLTRKHPPMEGFEYALGKRVLGIKKIR
jgi:hypothetical protein